MDSRENVDAGGAPVRTQSDLGERMGDKLGVEKVFDKFGRMLNEDICLTSGAASASLFDYLEHGGEPQRGLLSGRSSFRKNKATHIRKHTPPAAVPPPPPAASPSPPAAVWLFQCSYLSLRRVDARSSEREGFVSPMCRTKHTPVPSMWFLNANENA